MSDAVGERMDELADLRVEVASAMMRYITAERVHLDELEAVFQKGSRCADAAGAVAKRGGIIDFETRKGASSIRQGLEVVESEIQEGEERIAACVDLMEILLPGCSDDDDEDGDDFENDRS